jgi:hypothetical protein
MLPEELLKVMKSECKASYFLSNEFDLGIIGFDSMTDAVIYDLEILADIYITEMNFRDYDYRIGYNGGAAYYILEDGVRYWKQKFKHLQKLQKKGLLNGLIAPSYFES